MAGPATLSVKIISDFNSKGMDQAAQRTQQLGKVANVAGAALTAGLVVGAAKSVEAASNLAESANAAEVAFSDFGGSAVRDVEKLAQSASTNMGLSERAFNEAAVGFSGFIKQMGVSGGEATGTLDDLTQRAADFASVNNLEVSDAVGKFQSALAGSSEVMQQYGINLNAATVKEYAYANGIAETGDTLTEQQKIQARYGLLMESTAFAQDDFANTSDGLANSTRTLKADIENMTAALGEALLPIVEDAVGYFRELVDWMGKNQDKVRAFIAVLAGLAAAWVAVKAVMIAVQAATLAYHAVTLIIKAATAAWTVVQIALNVAMMLNPIGLIVVAIVALIAVVVAIVVATKDKWLPAVKAIWEMMKKWWDWIVAFFRPGFEAIGAFMSELWERIKSIFSGALDGLLAAWDTFSGAIIAAVKWYANLYVEAWTFIINTVKQIWDAGLNAVKAIWDRVSSAIMNAVNQFKSNWTAVWNAIKSALESVWRGIENVFNRARNNIQTVMNAIRSIVQSVMSAVSSAINGVKRAIDNIIAAFNRLRSQARSALSSLNPFNSLSIPNPFSRSSGASRAVVNSYGASTSRAASTGGSGVTVTGLVVDPEGTARAIRSVTRGRERRGFVPTPMFA